MTERTLDLAADADAARAAARTARALLDDVDGESAFACELSVAEACANVVEHSRSGRLRVVIRRRATRFSVAVCDEGIPFRPPPEPGLPPAESEGGRGVALMATCMDRIRVVRAGAENRLLMARRVESSRSEEEAWR
jgi:anti-sigma regulatory factor (Ser/Thr protein kinase)